MRRALRQPGFTMMELVLVLAVIAICAAIAAPSLSGFARGRVLPNTATELMTALRWCRMRALTEGVEYRCNLDKSANTWWVTKDSGDGSTFVDVSDNELGRSHTLPEGVIIQNIEFKTVTDTGDATYIPFLPSGRTQAASITLASDLSAIVVECITPLGTYHIVGDPK
jgi:type IV fimbrial biogenesis protein FimT